MKRNLSIFVVIIAVLVVSIFGSPTRILAASSGSISCNGNDVVASWSSDSVEVSVAISYGASTAFSNSPSGSLNIGPGTFDVSINVNGTVVASQNITCPGGASSAPGNGPNVEPCRNNGRVNGCDWGMTVTAYCLPGGGINVYRIENSQGFGLFDIGSEDVKAALQQANSTNAGIQLGEKDGRSLWALPNNQLGIGGPNNYKFVFVGNFCG